MKQKILFIKMLWSILKNKQSGYIFFRMTDQQQLDFKNNSKTVDIDLRYIGVDSEVVSKIASRLEKKQYL